MGLIDRTKTLLGLLPSAFRSTVFASEFIRTLEIHIELLVISARFIRELQGNQVGDDRTRSVIRKCVTVVKQSQETVEIVHLYLSGLTDATSPESEKDKFVEFTNRFINLGQQMVPFLSELQSKKQQFGVSNIFRTNSINEEFQQLLSKKGTTVISVVGSEGSGKTTFSSNLAYKLASKLGVDYSYISLSSYPTERAVADSIRSLLLQNTTMFKSSTILDESSLCSSYQYFISQFQKRKIILLDDVPNDTVLSKFIPVNKEVNLFLFVASEKPLSHPSITQVINLTQIDESEINDTSFGKASQLLKSQQSFEGLPVVEAIKKFINGSPLLLSMLLSYLAQSETVVDMETSFSKLASKNSAPLEQKLEYFLTNCVDPAHLDSLRSLSVVPGYFDESVVSTVLNIELDAAYSFCVNMITSGIFSPEPAPRLYKRYTINQHFRKILLQQMPKPLKTEASTRLAERYKKLTGMITWLMAQHITASTSMGLKIMEREEFNIRNTVQILMKDIQDTPLSLQFLYSRDILSILVDKKTLLQWYTLVRDDAVKQKLQNAQQYTKLYATLLNELATLYASSLETQKATTYLEEVLELCKNVKYDLSEAKAEVLLVTGKLSSEAAKSVDYFNKSHEIGVSTNNLLVQALAKEQIGLSSMYNNKTAAAEYFQKTLDIYSKLGNEYECMRQTMFIGAAESTMKQYPVAKIKYELALNLARGLGDCYMELEIYHHLANVYKNLMEYTKAINYFELCLTYRSNDKIVEGYVLSELASSYVSLGNKLKAIECYEKANSAYKEANHQLGMASAMSSKGGLLNSLGQRDKGIPLIESSVKIAQDLKQSELQALYQYNLGLAYRDINLLDSSIQSLETAVSLQSKSSDKHKLAVYTNALGVSLCQKGTYDKALEKYNASLSLVNQQGNTTLKPFVLCNIGNLLRLSKSKDAEAKLNEALIVSQTSSNQTTETYCLYNLGLLYLTTDPAKSKDYLDRAHKLAVSLGITKLEAEILIETSAMQEKPSKDSIAALERAAKLAKSTDPILEAKIYYEMASQYRKMEDKINSLQYYKQCLVLAKNTKDKDLMIRVKDDISKYLE